MSKEIKVKKEIRFSVDELETGHRIASVHDLVVALIDMYVRL